MIEHDDTSSCSDFSYLEDLGLERKAIAQQAIEDGMDDGTDSMSSTKSSLVVEGKQAIRDQSGSGAFAIAGYGATPDEEASMFQMDESVSELTLPQEEPRLVSAVLVEEVREERVPEVAFVLDVKKSHRHMWYAAFTLLAVVCVSVGIVTFLVTASKAKEQNMPSSSPSSAPTVDYLALLDTYEYITTFHLTVVNVNPENCTSTPSFEVLINATCLDNETDEFGFIYFFAGAGIDSCKRLGDHFLQCTPSSNTNIESVFWAGFACGTNSGNVTFKTTTEPLYDVSHCDSIGEIGSSIGSICEDPSAREVSPFCSTSPSSTDPECPVGASYASSSLTSSDPNCPTSSGLESSVAFTLKDVLFP